MRVVIQRVERASVTVDGVAVGAIGRGLLVLAGIAPTDGIDDVAALAAKLVGLRIFADDEGRMNRSVMEIGGSVLVVSQFTLLADARRGRRPSFTGAALPQHAEPLVASLMEHLAAAGISVAGGRFGARMKVDLVNDGPVTLVLDVVDGRIV